MSSAPTSTYWPWVLLCVLFIVAAWVKDITSKRKKPKKVPWKIWYKANRKVQRSLRGKLGGRSTYSNLKRTEIDQCKAWSSNRW